MWFHGKPISFIDVEKWQIYFRNENIEKYYVKPRKCFDNTMNRVLWIPWPSVDPWQTRSVRRVQMLHQNTKELLKISWIRLSSLPLRSQPVCNKGPQHPSLLRLIFNPLWQNIKEQIFPLKKFEREYSTWCLINFALITSKRSSQL